jgi:hypothetical protein
MLLLKFVSYRPTQNYLPNRMTGRLTGGRRGRSGQVRQHTATFDELAQALHNCRLAKELGKDFDLAMQFVVRNRLDESFGGDPAGSKSGTH